MGWATLKEREEGKDVANRVGAGGEEGMKQEGYKGSKVSEKAGLGLGEFWGRKMVEERELW